MRFLDVSVAAVVGLVSIATLVSWNPQSFEKNSVTYMRQASLQDYLASIVSAKGIAWFQNSPTGLLCEGLSAYSNSTVTVSAARDSLSCGNIPLSVAASANLTLVLGTGRLILRAWQVAGP